MPNSHKRQHGACNGKRHGKHDDERLAETLELKGQDEIDKQERENKRERRVGAALGKIPRRAGKLGVERSVQDLLGDFPHCRDPLAERLSLGERRRHRCRLVPVIMVEGGRAAVFGHGDKVVQLNEIARVVPDIQRRDVRRFVRAPTCSTWPITMYCFPLRK